VAENKTQFTDASVDDFIAAVPDPVRRADAEKVRAMMERLSGEPARMYGPTIIGFGEYSYRYESGRTGSAPRLGFSPRKAELVLYLFDGYEDKKEQLARLGKHRTGRACLYIKKLADLDEAVLEEMIQDSVAYMDAKYPRGS
jgi:hypothetical protein